MRSVNVKTSTEYDVIIGSGLLDHAGEYISQTAGGDIAVIVTDDVVAALYLERLTSAMTDAGYRTLVFTIPNGEASKTVTSYAKLLNFMAERGVTRTDVVVALGGGVVGDLAGFVAATYMRGIPYVQIPTTLLAAVDSSVGGKTAVDLDAGKNLAGAFYQPKIVLCDHSLLHTLPQSIFADGCAEVIKYGMIADGELFALLCDNPRENIEEIITRCVTIKRDVVCEDEFETGARKLLNFGHTAGHAVEHLSEYAISHGAAVGIGMVIETRAAVSEGWCSSECLSELIAALERLSLPTASPYSTEDIGRVALTDKKRSGDKITFIAPEEVGKCTLREITVGDMQRIITAGVGDG